MFPMSLNLLFPLQECLLNYGTELQKNHSFCEPWSKTVQDLIGQGQASVSLGK